MHRRGLVALVVLLLVAGGGVRAEESEIVHEVVRMLQAGVEERVVLRWLDREGHYPASLSSDDLIALTEAEASDELMDRLFAKPEAAEREVEAAAPAPAPTGKVPLPPHVQYRPFRDLEAAEDVH